MQTRLIDSRHIPLLFSEAAHSNTAVDVTVVTAYFDLGTFRKGSIGHYFTRDMYYNWAGVLRYMNNPLVIYTDSHQFKELLMAVRNESMNHTRIFVIERSSSWAFQNIDTIHKIYSSKMYPKHFPNTVVPAYACAQHAKFDVVSRAASSVAFNTKYYLWLDVGYFRNRKSKKHFYLSKPRGFDDSKIAMNLVNYKHNLKLHPETIMKENRLLVGGGLVFGEREHIIMFAAQFRRAVDYFLSEGIMNTDQQVIYSMFSEIGRKTLKPEVELQIYRSPNEYDWFYLGNSMVQIAD